LTAVAAASVVDCDHTSNNSPRINLFNGFIVFKVFFGTLSFLRSGAPVKQAVSQQAVSGAFVQSHR
jgi:hypothetical protein